MDVPVYLQVRGIFTNLHIITHEIYKVTLTALPKGDYAIHFVHLVIFYSSQKFMQLLMENDWLSFRGMQYWIHSLHSAAPLTRSTTQYKRHQGVIVAYLQLGFLQVDTYRSDSW